MGFLFLILTIYSTAVWSQSFLTDTSKIARSISQKQLDEADPKKPVPGAFFTPLINSGVDVYECEEKDKVPETQTRYEVLFIGQGSLYTGVDTSVRETLDPRDTVLIGPTFFNEIFTAPENYEALNQRSGKTFRPVDITQNYSSDSILKTAKDAFHNHMLQMDKKDQQAFDINSERGREVMVASIIQMGAQSKQMDKELAYEMGRGLAGVYKTYDEKTNFIQAMMKRFNYVYNEPRNPFKNNTENNPDNKPLPRGDMSMQNVFQAVVANNEFSGPVCNDAAEVAAMIADSLFNEGLKEEDKLDILVVNSGSHFNLTVTDGKKTTVIDGMNNINVNNDQMVARGDGATVLHINKVIDGKLTEIGAVDTQMGQVSEAMFRTGKKLLKTSTDVNTLVGEIKKINFRNRKNFDEYSVSAGYARLNDSHVVMVVAKITSERGPFSSYIGAGVGGQMFTDTDLQSNFFVDAKGGSRLTLFHYVNPHINFRATTGMEGSFNTPFNERFSWNVDWVNKISFAAQEKGDKAGYVAAEVETRHTLGSNNWGELVGANSTKLDIARSISNMNFYLNSVSANVQAAKPLTDSLKVQASASYLGSNVGQSVSALAGIEIKVPNGVEILVFSGYENDKLAGYQTHNGLLFGVQGATVGAQLKSKEGIKINTRMRGIGSEIMQGNVGVEIPLEIKRPDRE